MKNTNVAKQISVFVSFNQKSADFVNSLASKMPKDVKLLRFEDSVEDWSSFSDFMNSIGKHDFAVLVISDTYLKSKACMYEVLQQIDCTGWQNKTMFAVMPDANIYSVAGRINYLKYWAEEYNKYEKEMLGLPETALNSIRKEIATIRMIRDSIGDFLNVVSDSKNPPIYDVIDAICERINISCKTRFQMELHDGRTINTKYWLILEEIKENPLISRRDLSIKTGITISAISHALEKLENAGLITVIQDKLKIDKTSRMINRYLA